MTSFSFKRTVGDGISHYVSPTFLCLSVYSAFSALFIGAFEWLGGCSRALRTVGLVQGGSQLLMEMQWWCTLISWLRIGIIVRSNPYFGSSNSNYVIHDGVQLFCVEGCVENGHAIHSITGGQLRNCVRVEQTTRPDSIGSIFLFIFVLRDSRTRTCSANPHIQSTLHNPIPTLRCAPAPHRQVPTTHFTQHLLRTTNELQDSGPCEKKIY